MFYRFRLVVLSGADVGVAQFGKGAQVFPDGRHQLARLLEHVYVDVEHGDIGEVAVA